MQLRNCVKYNIFFILLLVLVNILTIKFYLPQKRIVVVDIRKINDNFIKNLAKNNPDEKIIKESTKNFLKSFDNLLKQIASDNNVVIFSKDLVLSGEDEDITASLEEILLSNNEVKNVEKNRRFK